MSLLIHGMGEMSPGGMEMSPDLAEKIKLFDIESKMKEKCYATMKCIGERYNEKFAKITKNFNNSMIIMKNVHLILFFILNQYGYNIKQYEDTYNNFEKDPENEEFKLAFKLMYGKISSTIDIDLMLKIYNQKKKNNNKNCEQLRSALINLLKEIIDIYEKMVIAIDPMYKENTEIIDGLKKQFDEKVNKIFPPFTIRLAPYSDIEKALRKIDEELYNNALQKIKEIHPIRQFRTSYISIFKKRLGKIFDEMKNGSLLNPNSLLNLNIKKILDELNINFITEEYHNFIQKTLLENEDRIFEERKNILQNYRNNCNQLLEETEKTRIMPYKYLLSKESEDFYQDYLKIIDKFEQ